MGDDSPAILGYFSNYTRAGIGRSKRISTERFGKFFENARQRFRAAATIELAIFSERMRLVNEAARN